MNILKLNIIKENNKIVIIKFKEMKKFMFFFLMVFLFLGINQARGEATTVTIDNGKSVTDWVLLSPASAMLDEIDGNPDTIAQNVRTVTKIERDTVRAPFTPMTTKIFTQSSQTDTLYYPADISSFTGLRDISNNPTLANGQVIQYEIEDTLSQLNLYDFHLFWILGADTVKQVNNKLTDIFFANPMLSTGNYSYKLQGDVNLVDTLNSHTRTIVILDMTIVDTTFKQDSTITAIDTIWQRDTVITPNTVDSTVGTITLIDTFQVVDRIDTVETDPLQLDTIWKDAFVVHFYNDIDTTYSAPFPVVDYIDTTYKSDTLSNTLTHSKVTRNRTVPIVNKTIAYRVVDNAGFALNAGTRYRCSEGAVTVRCIDWLTFPTDSVTLYESFSFNGLNFDEGNPSVLEQDSLTLITSGANSLSLTFNDNVVVGENAYVTKKYTKASPSFPYPGTYWAFENILVSERPELVLNSVSQDKINTDGTIDSILCAGSEFEVNVSILGGLSLNHSNINAILSIFEAGNPTPIVTRNIDSGAIDNFILDTLVMHDASTSYIFAVDYVQKNVNASLRDYG
ncbi:MAG TPA: hypothetical protein PK448_03570, partial [Bacteroidales bacterium]|nr:hypothetical protein [Bacteroidales bacterium]